MKLLVCVKHAGSLDDEYELRADGLAVEADALEWSLNEWDGFALEEALRIRDAAVGAEVVVVSVGDAADAALLDCLAKGADRAIVVADPALSDADVLQVARTLAAVVERERPDLVLCGVQSSDAVNGATGGALAGYLGLPYVAIVRDVAYDHVARSAVVGRELEGGVIERLRVRAPAVLSVQTGINEPRYATLRAIKLAREKPREALALADLRLAAPELAPGARVTAVAPPPACEGAQMLEGAVDEVAARIAEIVKDRLATASS